MDDVVLPAERYRRSSFYERLVVLVFISELLPEAWVRYGKAIEVLRPEVDNSGYDVVLECDGVVRHVQLKTSAAGGRMARRSAWFGGPGSMPSTMSRSCCGAFSGRRRTKSTCKRGDLCPVPSS